MKAFCIGQGPEVFLDPASVLDIGSCFVNGIDVAPGRAIPDDGDPRIDHSLEGFLFTCGPDHIRHPQPIAGRTDGKRYPLHGSFSSHEAEISSWSETEDHVECRASVAVTLADGGSALLERVWRMQAATGEVTLHDRVTNTGTTPFARVHMYHMNLGAHLFDAGVRLSGPMFAEDGLPWRFGEEPGSVFCVPATVAGQDWAEMSLGPIAALGDRTLKVAFRTDTLPYLQMWRNQKDPAHVLGIEPVSHRLADRDELEEKGELAQVLPGESTQYALRFSFV